MKGITCYGTSSGFVIDRFFSLILPFGLSDLLSLAESRSFPLSISRPFILFIRALIAQALGGTIKDRKNSGTFIPFIIRSYVISFCSFSSSLLSLSLSLSLSRCLRGNEVNFFRISPFFLPTEARKKLLSIFQKCTFDGNLFSSEKCILMKICFVKRMFHFFFASQRFREWGNF